MKLPWEHERNASEELSRIADEEIARLVSQAYDRAKAILSDHETTLRAVAEELKRTEVLDGKQLREIVQKSEGVSTETEELTRDASG
jgi:cell division protease FtsH